MGENDFYLFDGSTEHHYMVCHIYTNGQAFCRCKEDGFYYVLEESDLGRMHLRFLTPEDRAKDAMAYLEDKESIRLALLTKDRRLHAPR